MDNQLREKVLNRDDHRCRICGWSLQTAECTIEVHHITEPELMPNGGQVPENCISLCPAHLEWARRNDPHDTNLQKALLYRYIGITYGIAVEAAKEPQ